MLRQAIRPGNNFLQTADDRRLRSQHSGCLYLDYQHSDRGAVSKLKTSAQQQEICGSSRPSTTWSLIVFLVDSGSQMDREKQMVIMVLYLGTRLELFRGGRRRRLHHDQEDGTIRFDALEVTLTGKKDWDDHVLGLHGICRLSHARVAQQQDSCHQAWRRQRKSQGRRREAYILTKRSPYLGTRSSGDYRQGPKLRTRFQLRQCRAR